MSLVLLSCDSGRDNQLRNDLRLPWRYLSELSVVPKSTLANAFSFLEILSFKSCYSPQFKFSILCFHEGKNSCSVSFLVSVLNLLWSAPKCQCSPEHYPLHSDSAYLLANMVGRIRAPKYVHTLISGTCEFVVLHDKRSLANGVKVMDLKAHNGYIKWNQCNHMGTKTWKRKTEQLERYYKRRGRGNSSVRETPPAVVGFEERGMGPQTKECGGL